MAYLVVYAALFFGAVYLVTLVLHGARVPLKPGERIGAVLAWLAGGESRRRLNAILARRLEAEEDRMIPAHRDWARRKMSEAGYPVAPPVGRASRKPVPPSVVHLPDGPGAAAAEMAAARHGYAIRPPEPGHPQGVPCDACALKAHMETVGAAIAAAMSVPEAGIGLGTSLSGHVEIRLDFGTPPEPPKPRTFGDILDDMGLEGE